MQIQYRSIQELIVKGCRSNNKLYLQDSSLTYAELLSEVKRVAWDLKNAGIQQGDYVLLQIKGVRSFIETALGTFLIGAVPLSVTVASTKEQFHRIVKIYNSMKNSKILCDAASEEMINVFNNGEKLECIRVDRFLKQKEIETIYEAKPDEISMIQYSSGTTRNPKGACLTSLGIVKNIEGIVKHLYVTREDSLISWMPLTHNSGFIGIFGASLYTGATVSIKEPETFLNNPKSWLDEIERMQGTITVAPNFAYKYLLRLINENDNWNLKSMRLMITAAEPVSAKVVGQFVDMMSRFGLSSKAIVPAYGLTEATLLVSAKYDQENLKLKVPAQEIKVGIAFDESSIAHLAEDLCCLGKTIQNVEMRIADDHNEILPPLTIGNVQVGGATLCKGYIGEEELNKSLFTEDGWLNTGDIGFLADDELYIIGRKKDVVFYNGKNIFLVDLESIIMDEYKKRCAICNIDHAEEAQTELYAFIEADYKEQEKLRQDIKKLILQHVGVHITEVIAVETIPVNKTGKVDKGALQKIIAERKNEVHLSDEQILDKICEVFDKKIEADDETEGLIEDSITLIKRLYELGNAFEIKIELVDLLKCSKVAELINFIKKEKGIKAEEISNDETDNINHVEEGKWPLTNLQMSYYLGRDQAFYGGENHTHFYIELENAFNVKKLNQAFNTLIRRHELLRTVFIDSYAKVLEDVEEYKIREIPKELAEGYLKHHREAVQLTKYDVENWPLFNVKAVHMPNGMTRVCMDFDMLVVDGMSIGIILSELAALYREASLPAISISYKDYLSYYTEVRQSDKYMKDANYWEEKAKTFPLAPKLPLDLARINEPNIFKRIQHRFTKEEWACLREVCKTYTVTPSALLCYLYMYTLSKWSENKKFAINVTVFDRPMFNEEMKHLVGDFTSSILVDGNQEDYIDLSMNSHNGEKELFNQVKKLKYKILEYISHKDFEGTEFIRAISKSQDNKNVGLMPIVFTSMLFDEGFSTEGLGKLVYGISQTSQVYLDNQILKVDDGFIIEWDYLDKIFSAQVIEEMFSYYMELIQNVISRSSYQIAIPHLEGITAYNDTKQEMKSTTLNQLIKEAIETFGLRTALADMNKQITYSQLRDEMSKMCAVLEEAGIRRGDYVVIKAEKTVETIVAILSIVYMGAVYVPVPRNYPEQRIKRIQESCKSECILDCRALARKAEVTEIRQIREEIIRPSDSAYVIYTSGSTGLPKGVEITHGAVINTLLDINDRFNVNQEDSIIGLSALNFDLSVYDIFGTIICGGKLALVEEQRDVEEIKKVLEEQGVTLWNSVPAIMELFIEGVETEYRNTQVKCIMLSGDWIKLDLPHKIKAHFPNAQVISLGGATEASIWSIYYEIKAVDKKWKSIPYGYPLANQEIYILDEQQQICPVDVTGEIYIGGKGVAKGYLNDYEKTHASFLDIPQLGRVYKTGDYGVFRRAGYIEFLGRKDFQVKIHGHRIELTEISYQLEQLQDIAEAIVITGENEAKDLLIAYCRPQKAQGQLDQETIRNQLRNTLPEYMIPNYVMTLEEIPLTDNGKVNRKALPKIEYMNTAKKIMTPTNDVEQALVNIWQEVLKTEEISIDEDFFELGGDSLKAQKIILAIKEQFKVKIPIKEVIKENTVEKLAKIVSAYVAELEGQEDDLLTQHNTALSIQELFKLQDRLYDKGNGYRISYATNEYKEFKQKVLERRVKDSPISITLQDAAYPEFITARKSYRCFDQREISKADLAYMLSVFRQREEEGKKRYYYASSGGLYAIDVYVYVKANRVEGMQEGMYYYHPVSNSLYLVNEKHIPEDLHFYNNKAIFNNSACSIFFVYDPNCNMPVYGALGNYNALVDVGIMIAQLTTVSELNGLGLCSIGEMNFAEVGKVMGLENGEQVLHAIEIGYKPSVINKTEEPQPFPLTEVQLAYMTGRNNNIELGEYGAHYYLELSCHLDLAKFEESINEMISRHEMLRTVVLENGKQCVLKDVPRYKIAVTDGSQFNENERAQFIAERRKALSHTVYNVHQWPLFHFEGIQTENEFDYLLISMDLMVCDGASFQVLMKDLVNHYNGKALKPLNYSFEKYINRLQGVKSEQAYIEDRNYWLEKLEDLPTYPQVPVVKELNQLGHYRIQRKSAMIPKAQWDRIKAYAKTKQVSKSSLLCTLYGEVLSYWSNQKDLALNLTVFNRYPFHEEVEELVGDFTKLIILDMHLDGKEDLWEHARQVQETMLQGIDHINYDGVEVLREYAKNKGTINKALMPIVFTSMLFDDWKDYMSCLGQTEYIVSQTPQVFLDCQVVEMAGNLYISWDYVADLFAPEVIRNMFDQYVESIKNVEDEKLKVIAIPDTQRKLMEMYNATEKELQVATLQRLFVNQAAKRPEAPAIWFEERYMTYKELDEISNQVASYLESNGIKGKDTCVGILAVRCPQTIANILGVLKAGGAYVPINPDFPEERRKFILENSKSQLLLTPQTYEYENINSYDTTYHIKEEDLDALAYIIYTSGSTGMPKGVAITHEAAVNTILDINERFDVSQEDRIIGLSSMCFDLSVYDIFGALTSGATLVMVHDQRDVKEIIDVLERTQITIWNSVPAIMEMVLVGISENYKNGVLKHVLLSGDWIGLGLPDKIRAHFTHTTITSLGGATEASIWSIYYPIEAVKKEWRSIPYGMPLTNQSMYILDHAGRRCPVGTIGEICIGGMGVARGYINDEEKTNNAFVIHPLYGRIYKTGDYGRMHEAGYIEFLGRRDQQVKIRGYRIEIGEVEHHLSLYETITNVVVTVKMNHEQSQYLCAYYEAYEEIPVETLRQHMAQTLPDYMVPSFFIKIEKMPLTMNGKVDLKALPEPDFEHSKTTGLIHAVPTNEKEKAMLEVCANIFEVENISLESSFFELGGDSIKAIQIIVELEKRNMKLEVKDLFATSTLGEIADKIAYNDTNTNCVAEPVVGEVALTPIQRWFFDHIKTDVSNWTQYTTLYSKEILQLDRIREVFEKIMEVHDALRINFEWNKGEYKQINRAIDEATFGLEEVDVRGEINCKEQMLMHIKSIQQEMDIEKGKLICLIHFVTDEGSYLVINIHHLLTDGISTRILIDDFKKLYQASRHNLKLELMPESSSYKQWSEYLLEQVNRSDWKQIEAYWQDVIEAGKEQRIGNIIKETSKQKNTRIVEATLSKEETHILLKDAHQSYHTEINDLLLAALARTIYSCFNKQELLIDLETHGRFLDAEGLNINRTLGWFTGICPVLLKMTPAEEVGMTIKNVKENLRNIPNRGVEYLSLRYGKDDQAAYTYESQITFNYLGQIDNTESDEDIYMVKDMIGQNMSSEGERFTKIYISSMVIDDVYSVVFDYDSTEFTEGQMKMVVATYIDELKDIIKHCITQEEEQYTASDFGSIGMSEEDLSNIFEVLS